MVLNCSFGESENFYITKKYDCVCVYVCVCVCVVTLLFSVHIHLFWCETVNECEAKLKFSKNQTKHKMCLA